MLGTAVYESISVNSCRLHKLKSLAGNTAGGTALLSGSWYMAVEEVVLGVERVGLYQWALGRVNAIAVWCLPEHVLLSPCRCLGA